MAIAEKIIPYNIDAECGVLGSLLIDPEAISLVADSLKPGDFYRHTHQIIYKVMLALYAKGEPADVLTLSDQLQVCGEKEIDVSYLARLVNRVPTSANTEYYASIIRRESVKRGLIKIAGQIATIGYDADNADAALEQVEQLVYDLSAGTVSGDLVSSRDMMANFLAQLDCRLSNAGQVVGVPLPFRHINFELGGFQPGELYILGGRPGMGKSSFMLSIIYDLMLAPRPFSIALFSLEMSEEDVSRRLVSMDTGIDSQCLRTRMLDDRELQRVIASTERLEGERLFVDQSSEVSLAAVRSKSRRHKMRYGLDLVVVDYLQLMNGDNPDVGRKPENRAAEIGKISRGLKILAKELNVPVLALASMNRAVESRAGKRPMLSDLRESGSIESDADVVMFISKHPEKPDVSIVDIAKHRHGKVTGDEGILLAFDGALTLFSDMEVANYA